MIKAGIIGASGYTGRELVKILIRHPRIASINVYGRTYGESLSKDIPELKGTYEGLVKPIEPEIILRENDVLFMALPHNVSMDFSPSFQNKIPLIDLSADYRLTSASSFKTWYGADHKDPSMLSQYTYGLPEINREKIKKSKLIANPGCYPTSVLLGILPLIEKSLVRGSIIVDAKSGHSGAGKKLSEILHAGNVTENIQPYKILNHQHIGEIEQIMTERNTGVPMAMTFTPYVMPYERGILSTIYADLTQPVTQAELKAIYEDRYSKEPFIRLFLDGKFPSPKICAHTNYCDVAFVVNEKLNRVTILSCIDNLVKGASGQAVHNMNLMFDFNEKDGLHA